VSAGKFDFLKAKQADQAEKEAETPPASRPEPAVKQYGRRADPEYVQLSATIPAELRRRLRVRLASEERALQDVLEALLEEYLAGRVKI